MDAFAHMKLRRDQPGPHGRTLGEDRAGFTHSDVDNATFCRAASGAARVVRRRVFALTQADEVRREQHRRERRAARPGRQGRQAGLAALKLIDRDEACVSPDEATPEKRRVLIGEQYATPEEGRRRVAGEGTRARASSRRRRRRATRTARTSTR